MPLPPLSYRIQTGFRNAPTAPALLYNGPSGPFLPPHTRLLPEAYQALHPVSVIRLSIYGKLRKLSKLLSLSYTYSLFLPSGIRAGEKFCLLFIRQSQRGNPAKNIHAARNTRRTAVPFPTVLFMDFIIGIHNSMLNCGPYHTVCNIKNSAIIPAQMVSAIRIPNSPPIIFICISSCNTSYLFGTSPL